jgi:hypothetical protein
MVLGQLGIHMQKNELDAFLQPHRKIKLKMYHKLGMVAYKYNTSSWKAEARGSLVTAQPGLHSKPLSEERKKRQPQLLVER